MPLFSIIVPCFNSSKYIHQCLDSIINQSYCDYEVIIVDDGSTDDTVQIVQSFHSTKIKIVISDHQGVSCARNKGIMQAIGDYILLIDSDDYIIPDALKNFKECIDTLPHSDIYVGGIVPFVDFNEKVKNDYFKEEKLEIKYLNTSSKDIILDQLIEKHIYTCFIMRNVYDRKFLLENNILYTPQLYHEDEEWTTKVYVKARKIKFANNDFYYYRIHSNSLMHDNCVVQRKDEERYISLLKIIVSLYSFILSNQFSQSEIAFIQAKCNYYLWILPDEIQDFQREQHPLLFNYINYNNKSILNALTIITYKEEREWMENLIEYCIENR